MKSFVTLYNSVPFIAFSEELKMKEDKWINSNNLLALVATRFQFALCTRQHSDFLLGNLCDLKNALFLNTTSV